MQGGSQLSAMLNRLIRRIPLNFRYSTDNFKTKLPSNLIKETNGNTKNNANTSKMQLTTSEIEQYKKQLYEMIKQRREPNQIQELNRFLIEGCEPSLHLFNIILKGQLMMRNVEGIKETLLLIAKNKFAFNSITLNLLLVYYRDLDMMEDAEKLFEAMQLRGKEASPLINCAGPNLSAYTTMIAGWTRRGDFEKAKKYYESIGREGNNELKVDEHAMCAMLNAAVSTGHLEYAKKLYDSMLNPNFVALKLWLRATFRLGGYEAALEKLMVQVEESLELGELIKWILSDLKQDSGKLSKVSLYVLEASLNRMRLGDPQCLHALLDALKKDVDALTGLCHISLNHPERTLPIIGGRVLHHLLASNPSAPALSAKIVEECGRLGIPIPSGLLSDFNKKKTNGKLQ